MGIMQIRAEQIESIEAVSGDLADEQDPKAHDHQGVGSDGGKLTGAIVDSYEDFEEIAAPANPGVNVARVYSKDDGGTTKLYYRRSDGTELELGLAAGALPAHDHQGVGADGGKLTGAIVDSFQDFEEIGAPANPGVNVARVYSRDDAGTTKFYYRRSDGTEVELGAAGVSTDIGCRIYHDAAQSVPTGTWTALAFNSERRDDGGLHNPAVNNSRITFGQAGWYSCFGNVQFASGGGTLRGLLIRKNGATIIAISSLNLIDHKFLSSVYYFVATDYIELEAYQDTGGNLNIQSTAEYTPEFAVMIGSR